jgi:hypothetical protein
MLNALTNVGFWGRSPTSESRFLRRDIFRWARFAAAMSLRSAAAFPVARIRLFCRVHTFRKAAVMRARSPIGVPFSALADLPPVVDMPRFPGTNEPCPRHSENAIRRHDVRRGNACLTISSLHHCEPGALATMASSSVMSMARLRCVVSVVLRPPAWTELPHPHPRNSADKGNLTIGRNRAHDVEDWTQPQRKS